MKKFKKIIIIFLFLFLIVFEVNTNTTNIEYNKLFSYNLYYYIKKESENN